MCPLPQEFLFLKRKDSEILNNITSVRVIFEERENCIENHYYTKLRDTKFLNRISFEVTETFRTINDSTNPILHHHSHYRH